MVQKETFSALVSHLDMPQKIRASKCVAFIQMGVSFSCQNISPKNGLISENGVERGTLYTFQASPQLALGFAAEKPQKMPLNEYCPRAKWIFSMIKMQQMLSTEQLSSPL